MTELTMDSKAIGNRLRSLRGDRTQEKVAEDLGMSRSALNMYELGERIPRDCRKIQLAQYYGVTIEQLFFYHE